MTVRSVVGAWVTAIALVAGAFLVILTAAPKRSNGLASPTVALGSSLTAYAIPVRGEGAASLLGDRRAHRRIAISRISENQLLDLLDEALDGRPKLVLVEANPLLYSFADSRGERPCDGWVQAVRARLARLHAYPVGAARRLAGLATSDGIGELQLDLDRAQSIDPATIRRLYPLVSHDPCDIGRFAALVHRAEQQRTRVVLLLLPRSPAAIAEVGAGVDMAIRRRTSALAARLGVAVVPLTRPWPNAEFMDQAHLNRAGREHMLADLRRWWRNAS